MPPEPVRHAVRTLRHDWRTTLLAVGLLAVTIGAVMAIFAIVDAVLLRPLPVANQDRVVVIWQRDDRRALPIIEVAYGEMVDWRARSRSFERLAVIGSVNWSLTLAGAGEPVQIARRRGLAVLLRRRRQCAPCSGAAWRQPRTSACSRARW